MNKTLSILTKNKHNVIIFFSIIISIILTETISFFSNCSEINDNIFRLHILANSNTAYDQELKLLVRDKILQMDNTLFLNKDISTQTLALIKEEAQSVLTQMNCNLPVEVEVTNMYFTTRFYEKFTLPAGNYDALRITIGQAKGENWWCVLYPPLCLPAMGEQTVIDEVLPTEQADIIEMGDKYEFKFALYELYTTIKNAI